MSLKYVRLLNLFDAETESRNDPLQHLAPMDHQLFGNPLLDPYTLLKERE